MPNVHDGKSQPSAGGLVEAKLDTGLTEEENRMRIRIQEVMSLRIKGSIPALSRVERKRLNNATRAVNKILDQIQTTSMSELNSLVYAGAVVVMENVGYKQTTNTSRVTTPWWKRRLETDKGTPTGSGQD